MIDNNLGQQTSVWDASWKDISPLTEIRMWDFYGGRQWIAKYAPRFGNVVEAGCGVGRYVFYLKKFGIDIEGIDFSDAVIEKLEKEKEWIEPAAVFKKGDVLNLPYPDESLSGYISLGVVEHFIEGPQRALAEAYKKLRPGGVAIVTTPNKSFLVLYRALKRKIKNFVKKIIGRKIIISPFFQYEYSAKQLKKFLKEQGFHVSRAESCDLLYPFCEIGGFSGKNLDQGKFAYWFSQTFENTFVKCLGGQSITISVKKAPLMYCFLSGKLNATPDSLDKFDVPISSELQDTEIARKYSKNQRAKYAQNYVINPSILHPESRVCDFSGKEYITDYIFEDFGFNKNIAPDKLSDIHTNIKLSTDHIKPVWRSRKRY